VKSRTIREIIADVREGARRGFGRILLSAHDSGAYGNDIGYDLPRLLEDVLKVEGNFRISMDCINPNHLLRHLDEYIRLFKSEKMLRYLYPPLESGNDRILRMMKRPYKAGDILKALERFRQEIPAIEFGTDLIVGFPTETEEDFRDTLKVITTIPFRILNIFPYSPRPATEAAGFPGQIPEAVKRERCRRAEKTWKKMNRVFRR
jgi:threonylcarbamoyladenosine tRNA methylthiotransferase CDKAL1